MRRRRSAYRPDTRTAGRRGAVGVWLYLGTGEPAGETLARSMFPVQEIFTEPDAVLAARLFNQTGRHSRSLAEDIKEAAPDVTRSRI